MKRSVLVISIGLFLVFSVIVGHCADLVLNDSLVQIYFSPNGGCTEGIVKEINNAKSEILVQAYSFTSTPIAKSYHFLLALA